MRVPGSRRARQIILLSLAALVATIGWFLYARAQALYRTIGPLVVAELERQLGREVSIGKVITHPLGRVVLEQVAVASEQRLSEGTLFRARRIVLTYSLQDVLWFRTDVVGSVRRIDVEQPYLLLVREPDGTLNLQKLFKPKPPGAPPTRFRAQVVVTGGRLLFRDYKAALPRLPAENEVGGVNGVVDYRAFPRITARATGAGRRGRAGPVQATTFIDTGGRWLIQALATDAEAAYWAHYFVRTPAVRVLSGRANVDLVVDQKAAKTPLEYVVNLAGQGLGARLARMPAPIQSGRGVAQITPFGVKLEASGALAGMPVQVSGNILDWKHPQVAISVRGSGITLAAVRRALPQAPAVPGLTIETPGQASAWILGPASQLYVTGSLSLPAASWRGERIRDVSVAYRYHAGMLQFDRITAAAADGGRLVATGWAPVLPAPARLYVTGRLEDLNLAGLHATSHGTNLRGQGDVQFVVSGTARDLHAAATVRVSRLILNTARLDAATARLDYQDGVLYVRSLQAVDQRGRLTAAGTVGRRGDLHLQVRAKGIDLAALLVPFTKQPASGTAFFSGSVGGTLGDPRLAGLLQVYAGKLGNIGTDYAEGRLVLRPDRVETGPDGLALRLYPGQVTLHGTAGGWRERRPRLDVTAAVQDLEAARLLSMANLRIRATGSISGDLSFRGDPTALTKPVAAGRPGSPPGFRVAGTLRVDDLLAEGARLGTATATVETNGGKLWVRQASVEGEALAMTAQGSVGLVTGAAPANSGQPAATGWINKDSPLDLTFAVQRLDLARVASRSGARVLLEGSAHVTDGVVKGRVGAPVVTAQAEVAPLTVNGVSFKRLSGQAAYTSDRVTLRDLALSEDGGAIRVTQAMVTPKPGKPANGLSVDAQVESFPLQRLIEVAQRSAAVGGRAAAAPAPTTIPQVEGALSGTITARPAGTAAGAPTTWTAVLNAPAVRLPGYRLAAETGPTTPNNSEPLVVGLKARATYSTSGQLRLEQLAVTRGDGVLLASGSAVQEGARNAAGEKLPQGYVKLSVDATFIPIGLFEPLAPALHPLRGTGELHLDAEGPLRTPAVKGSMDIDKPALAGVPFSHFAVPFLQASAPPTGGLGKIRLENARLEVDDKDHPNGQHLLLVDGALPFQWVTDAKGRVLGGKVPDDQPLSLSVRLPQQSLDVLTSLSSADPQGVSPRVAPVLTALRGIGNVSGTMSADLTVSGTRVQPNTNGTFRVENGAFQPQRGQTRFDQIAVALGFTGDRIEVQQLQGRSSDGGGFTGSGTITGIALGVGGRAPAAQMDLALSLDDLRYKERNLTGFLQERFQGTLRTVDRSHPEQRAPVRLVGAWPKPRVTGAVQAVKTHLQLPGSLPEPRAQAVLPIANPSFDLNLLLGKDVWLENPHLRLQMTGNLPVRGTLAEPIVRGTLVVERGQIIFPTARFRVEGDVQVAYAPAQGTEAPVPLRVDLTATAHLSGTDPNTRQRQRYNVTLEIRGPLTAEAYEPGTTIGAVERPASERLTIESRSDPPLSQQQILALIGRQSSVEAVMRGGGDASKALQQEISDTLISGWAAPAVFTPLETAIEDWLGLDEFSLDFALREPLQLRLTKQLYGPFYATYTQSFNAFGTSDTSLHTSNGNTSYPNLYSLELFYRISDRYRFGYRIEQPVRNQVIEFNGTFRF